MKLGTLAVLGACAVFHGGVFASDADLLGQRYASTCANCHGTNGAVRGDVVPALAGLSKDYIVNTMKEFKQGKRQATVMHQIAKGYSDEQIAMLAAYFSTQKK